MSTLKKARAWIGTAFLVVGFIGIMSGLLLSLSSEYSINFTACIIVIASIVAIVCGVISIDASRNKDEKEPEETISE